MKPLKFDSQFIISNMDALIHLVDYVPLSFVEYDMQGERDEFLKSLDLLSTIRDMWQLIDEKCNHYDDPIFAWNCVVVEWLDCHPEFEGIISEESSVDYQDIKNNDDFLSFLDLLYDVELPSEKKVWDPSNEIYIRDDSSIQLPDFKKIDDSFEKYGDSLLSCYLS